MRNPTRQVYADRRWLWVVVALAAVAIASMLLLRERSDGLELYPHAFLAEPGYDPAKVVVVLAPIEWPPPPPADCLPAWQCSDPVFADAQGRPWLFPMRTEDGVVPTPPSHPQLRRRPEVARCSELRTPEGEALLEAYRARRSP